jgi:dTDP-4-amino-4,6-dideoxygalactose transaminase
MRGNEGLYLAQCVQDNWISSAGPFIPDFEEQIAKVAGTDHAVALCNGTIAIKIALLAAGIRPGDGVIVPDWSFIASANAVTDAQARPIFVDIDPVSWALDVTLIEKAISTTARIKAILAVHPLGFSCDMNPILTLARDHGIAVIEDAAGAIGASYHGNSVGGLGDFGCFSFNGNKLISAGAGGAVTTNNTDAAQWIRHVTAQARIGTDYRHDQVGFNYRMSNLNAAVGLAQLERMAEMRAHKDRIATRYSDILSEFKECSVKPMPNPNWGTGNNWLNSVLCSSKLAAEALVAHMHRHGIEARIFWRHLSGQKPYATHEKHVTGVAKSLSGRVVSLPSSTNISDAALDRVCDALRQYLLTTNDKN